jgi:uncharacterized protein (DUF58 family)
MNHDLIDWGALAPLRLRAKEISAGLFLGRHRSQHRGAGIEFDSHRDYVPGDDLRRLDYRALARHDRYLVRQFETETERRLCLVVDATVSMAFSSDSAKTSKLAYAGLLSAALARIAAAGGDRVSLDWLGGAGAGVGVTGGRVAFERVVEAFEHQRPAEPREEFGETREGSATLISLKHFEQCVQLVARSAQRGAIVVFVSDLVDLPEGAAEAFATIGNRHRSTVVVRVLDPVEATFPFSGPVRLRPSIGNSTVETDAQQARAGYLKALTAQSEQWRTALQGHNGRMVECQTNHNPVPVLREILNLIGDGARS